MRMWRRSNKRRDDRMRRWILKTNKKKSEWMKRMKRKTKDNKEEKETGSLRRKYRHCRTRMILR